MFAYVSLGFSGLGLNSVSIGRQKLRISNVQCIKVTCGRWQIQWGPLGDIASSATKTLTNAAEAAAKISVTGV